MPVAGGSGSEAPAKAASEAGKAQRLLPKELRRRRRAAKLQANSAQEQVSEPSHGHNGSQTTATHTEAAIQPAATTTSRLHSFYTRSAQDRKKQRLLHSAHVDVPSTFLTSTIPVDVVPKRKMVVLTAFPYPFLRCNSRTKHQALQSFMTPTTTSPSQNPAVQWHKALYYYAHPATPLPASITLNRISASTKNESISGAGKNEFMREEKAFYNDRWRTWQAAFRDVYLSFRQGANGPNSGHSDTTASFYVRSSDFVVCFHRYDAGPAASTHENANSLVDLCRKHVQEAGTMPEDGSQPSNSARQPRHHVCAVMSQSSARVRKALHRLNVEYTMPYTTAKRTQRETGEFHLLEEELVALEADRGRNSRTSGVAATVTRSAAPTQAVHGADSLLLFHGHQAVHGLYEFLINRAPTTKQDVPELCALHPFANASIQSLQVMHFGRVGQAGPSPDASGSAGSKGVDPRLSSTSSPTTLFRTEITGFCFPSSVTALLDVLKNHWVTLQIQQTAPDQNQSLPGQENAVRAHLEAIVCADRLNAVHLDEQVADPDNSNNRDLAARARRSRELDFTKRRLETVAVRQDKMDALESPCFHVETTAWPTRQ